jgi:tetratricopeptide (TPR) repeat protein
MRVLSKNSYSWLVLLILLSCGVKRDESRFKNELQAINLARGDIALCGAEAGFGTVRFSLSCRGEVQEDFNLATALLHSFEYLEAEKVFGRIIDKDPNCLMAYWGAAMCSFHPLWDPPTENDLEKGSKVISLARSMGNRSTPEWDYVEAIATIYDDWNNLDHRTRVLKFEKAAMKIYQKYPDDSEAAIFYSLALRAAADPSDKTFQKQIRAGEILNTIFPNQPDHPGIAHYIIHTYDYPELAERALPAARKYASIAAASAHAQHMPSHIFTRLGLWEESVQSNINSVSAAKCYAENVGIEGHWDEELHGLDYLVYAYLQQGRDDLALEQVEYVKLVNKVFPINGKVAYSMASIPTRYALERKDWKEATRLELMEANIDWENFLWEKAIVHFGRVLGFVHTQNLNAAREELNHLKSIQLELTQHNKQYEANQTLIQVRASEAWINWAEGKGDDALKAMIEAADREDATEKHPFTPGEVLPARELLGDLFLAMNKPDKALEAYQSDLKRHPGRFNGLYGAALANAKMHNRKEAMAYFQQLADLLKSGGSTREAKVVIQTFLKGKGQDEKLY